MKRFVGWLRGLSRPEKLMLALVVVLAIGVVVRWAWIRREVTDALRERFTAPTEEVASGDIEKTAK